MTTLLLDRPAIVGAVQAISLLGELRAALAARGSTASGEGSVALHDFGAVSARYAGMVPDIPAFTTRVASHFPHQVPATHSVILLHDLRTGALLSILEGTHLSQLSSALVGALSADVLARVEATRVAILGASDDTRRQLKALRLVRTLSEVRVFDPQPEQAQHLAQALFSTLSVPAHAYATPEETVATADLIIGTEQGFAQLTRETQLPSGCHLILPPRREWPRPSVADELLGDARWVVAEQAPSEAYTYPAGVQPVGLGAVLRGEVPGRTKEGELTAFAPCGLPLVDLVAAWHAYVGAREDESLPRIAWEG